MARSSGYISPEYGGGGVIVLSGGGVYLDNEGVIQPTRGTGSFINTVTTILNNASGGTMKTPVNNCSCLTGTPYIMANGACGCVNESVAQNTPVKTTRQPVQITVTGANENSLLKNPLVLVGAGILAFLLLKK